MSPSTTTLADLAGTDLGTHVASYDDTAVILYALAVGVPATELELVYERDLRTLPTYACALGLWAVEAAGRLGMYDPHHSLHASQQLVVKQPLPSGGEVPMSGRIANVYDKGKAALLEIEVDAPSFTATYNIFLPGLGGWGGNRGPSAGPQEAVEHLHHTQFHTSPDLAALYRLTGDRHPIHIDPSVAHDNGFDRPILHGLCTLGIAARVSARQVGAHPADLHRLSARLAAPVLPGNTLDIASGQRNGAVHFTGSVNGTTVLSGGTAEYGPAGQ